MNIQTYLRIRPSKKPSGFITVDDVDPNTINVKLPESFKSEYVDNSRMKYEYHFNGIMTMDYTQDNVFKLIGAPAVENALEGYNSTIFAYGQTGSGKTFTLTGGPEKYSDRGIIPRAISMLFNEIRTRTNMQFKVYISYLEIYNEQGYDLLDTAHEAKKLEELPKVRMLEDEFGNFHLKNLSMNPGTSICISSL
jgi:kinesin family protein 6/9